MTMMTMIFISIVCISNINSRMHVCHVDLKINSYLLQTFVIPHFFFLVWSGPNFIVQYRVFFLLLYISIVKECMRKGCDVTGSLFSLPSSFLVKLSNPGQWNWSGICIAVTVTNNCSVWSSTTLPTFMLVNRIVSLSCKLCIGFAFHCQID